MSAPNAVTAGMLAAYLKAHPHAPATVEILATDGPLVYVRWPSGSLRWQPRAELPVTATYSILADVPE